MKRFLMASCLFVLLGSSAAVAVAPVSDASAFPQVVRPKKTVAAPAPAVRQAIGRLVAEAGKLEYVRLSSDGRSLECLVGELAGKTRETPEAQAFAFLNDHAPLLGLGGGGDGAASRWRLVKKVGSQGVTRLVMQRLEHSVPVYGALASFYFGRHGTLNLVGNLSRPLEKVDNRCRLSRDQAVQAALAALGQTEKRGAPSTQLTIWAPAGAGKLAWQVRLPLNRPAGDWELLIDAETGNELHRVNQAVFAETHSAQGKVYLHHSLVSPVTLETMTNLTADRLVGAYASVITGTGYTSAWPNNGVYSYEPSNLHFGEVMAYFHVNRMHEFYRELGFDREHIDVVANMQDMDNAYYTSWSNQIVLGDGAERFYNTAYEESIIYHEYAHGVVDKILNLHGNDGSAMNEGQADFFAAVFSGDPVIGEFVARKSNRPYLRTLENTLHYPEDLQHEPHDDGRIWGGTLWDLQKIIGGRECAALVLKSYFALKPEPTFADGLVAIVQADQDHFQGKYRDTILSVFARRGFSLAGANTFSARDLRTLAAFENLHGR